jgi:transposase-like protein/IS1 family transposase
MNCQTCNGQTKKFGKDRDGHQRYRCLSCDKTFTESHEKKARLVGDMILADDKALAVIHHLVEGCSIRSIERLVDVHRDTILKLLEVVGEKCERLMRDRIHGVPTWDCQLDEQWQYIGMKAKTKKRKGLEDDTLGDSWVFTAIDRTSKLILAWHLGHRTMSDTVQFTDKLAWATEGHHNFQITTDGFPAYRDAVVLSLGAQHVNFAQLIKVYQSNPDEKRYSPAQCIGIEKVRVHGNPDMDRVCTSHVERHNLSTRMSSRRYTRLTNAFSKKWAKHNAALALWYAYYNFCRVHQTLKVTPAMEAGITDHIWTLRELIE